MANMVRTAAAAALTQTTKIYFREAVTLRLRSDLPTTLWLQIEKRTSFHLNQITTSRVSGRMVKGCYIRLWVSLHDFPTSLPFTMSAQ